MLNFNELPLKDSILSNLKALDHHRPTPIQAEAIPYLLEGHDLLGIAQTGTGKTAAFSLPIIHQLLTKGGKAVSRKPRAVILAPTRELASQIHESFEAYSNNLHLTSTAIFGGIGQKVQVQKLRDGLDVVVATPGRFLDLMEQGYILLTAVEIFVLDEADRMLDMGFIEDIHKIIQRMPPKKQTMLFSATMPKEIAHLAGRILKNPKRVEVNKESITIEKIKQKVIFCKQADKFQLLKKIIDSETPELTIVFTKTKNSADKVVEYLTHHHVRSISFHGDKAQKEREHALNDFKMGRVKVLVATDIAARGIDVSNVTHVINYDLPLEAESYVHRIGRTARAGTSGEAISFCDESELNLLERIQQLIQLYLPTEKFVGVKEAQGSWTREKKITPPTPGKSQEKSAFVDHSKRRKPVTEGGTKASSHPGFRNKKTKKKKR